MRWVGNGTDMDGVKVGGTPFNVLMQQAVAMKTARHAVDRRRFDSLPRFRQNSMFATDEMKGFRALGFQDRMAAAVRLKEEGTALFKGGAERFVEAGLRYENAVAVFRYFENLNPNWKNSHIEDAHMLERDFLRDDGPSDAQKAAVRELCLGCYLNMSLAYARAKDFAQAVQAADEALKLDERCVKAYYRRAMALIGPAGSGGTEAEQATADLQKAFDIDPTNRAVRKQLQALRRGTAQQRRQDRKTFAGMFDRGELYSKEELQRRAAEAAEETDAASGAPDGAVAAIDRELARMPFEQQVRQMEMLAERFEREEDHEKAGALREALRDAKRKEAERRAQSAAAQLDFRNPTAEMIADAEARGIDLSDPAVQRMLEDLQRRRGGAPPEEEAPADGGAAAVSVDEVLQVLQSSTGEQIRAMMAQRGMDPGSATRRDLAEAVRREMMRDEATLRSLRGAGGSGSSGAGAGGRLLRGAAAMGFWPRTILIGTAIVAFRLYSMGLLLPAVALLAEDALGLREVGAYLRAMGNATIAGGADAPREVDEFSTDL